MKYIKIDPIDIANGEGVRTVLWCSGCKLHCDGCHNQNTWSFDVGTECDINTTNEILNYITEPYIDGITFSGGNPLEEENIDYIIDLIYDIKDITTKTIWLYTGLVWEEAIKNPKYYEALSMCDVVVDGPFILAQKDISLQFRGSKNQRLIDVKKTIEKGEVVIYEENSV